MELERILKVFKSTKDMDLRVSDHSPCDVFLSLSVRAYNLYGVSHVLVSLVCCSGEVGEALSCVCVAFNLVWLMAYVLDAIGGVLILMG